MTYTEENLPFGYFSGIRPDIIINPQAIPSRMTVGHVLECHLSKMCALKGVIGYADAYHDYDNLTVEQTLEKFGFTKHATEPVMNPFTGELMKGEFYMGPIFYQRLKHMVDDKIHARSRGTVHILTHQPVEGRARGGGLRFGESKFKVFSLFVNLFSGA
jgi:DNA-directed RNA polymerase II subunit RPB2